MPESARWQEVSPSSLDFSSRYAGDVECEFLNMRPGVDMGNELSSTYCEVL